MHQNPLKANFLSMISNFINKLYFNANYWRYINTRRINTHIFDPCDAVLKNYSNGLTNGKRIIIATQVGRGGGKWLCDILNHNPETTAYGERNRLVESIYRYYSSYDSNISFKSFVDLLKTEALTDWDNGSVSYISSPYFSHGLQTIYSELHPYKIVVLLNEAFKVAVSLYNKGWYAEDVCWYDTENIGFIAPQFSGRESHFYGRYIHLDVAADEFSSLTRLGKIAVYMSATLSAITSSLLSLPHEKIYLFRLAQMDQNYDGYLNMMEELGLKSNLSKKKFLSLKKRTSASFENKIPHFSNEELTQFSSYIFTYEQCYENLIARYSNAHISE